MYAQMLQTCVYMYKCEYVCGINEQLQELYFRCHPPCFLKQSCSWFEDRHFSWSGWPRSPGDLHVSASPRLGLQVCVTRTGSYLPGFWGSSSGLCVCVASPSLIYFCSVRFLFRFCFLLVWLVLLSLLVCPFLGLQVCATPPSFSSRNNASLMPPGSGMEWVRLLSSAPLHLEGPKSYSHRGSILAFVLVLLSGCFPVHSVLICHIFRVRLCL